MRATISSALFIMSLGATACGSDDPPARGGLGVTCANDQGCESALVCRNSVCSNPQPDAGLPVDAGFADGGLDLDGGPEFDAGPEDAGGCDIPPTLLAIRDRIFGEDNGPFCNQASCHGTTQPALGIGLTLPLDQLRETLLGPTHDPIAPQRTLVVPFDPEASRLWVIMSNPNPSGQRNPMPPPPSELVPDCELGAVRTWIANGALLGE